MLSSVVLSAGESKRMGRPKALLEFGGATFLETICSRIWQAGVDELIVVLGADADLIRGRVALSREKVVVNSDFKLGQLSSLQCGLKVVNPQSRAVLVTLVDHPLISGSTYRGLVEAWEEAPENILLAVCGDRGGHPVVFPRSVFAELMEAPLDVGARYVVGKYPGRVRRLEFDDVGITADIDRPEDYEKFVKPDGDYFSHREHRERKK